jgi:hypothetical protein
VTVEITVLDGDSELEVSDKDTDVVEVELAVSEFDIEDDNEVLDDDSKLDVGDEDSGAVEVELAVSMLDTEDDNETLDGVEDKSELAVSDETTVLKVLLECELDVVEPMEERDNSMLEVLDPSRLDVLNTEELKVLLDFVLEVAEPVGKEDDSTLDVLEIPRLEALDVLDIWELRGLEVTEELDDWVLEVTLVSELEELELIVEMDSPALTVLELTERPDDSRLEELDVPKLIILDDWGPVMLDTLEEVKELAFSVEVELELVNERNGLILELIVATEDDIVEIPSVLEFETEEPTEIIVTAELEALLLVEKTDDVRLEIVLL